MSVTATCLGKEHGKNKPKIVIESPSYSVNDRNGTVMVKGKCPKCGGKVATIVKAENAPEPYRGKAMKIRQEKRDAIIKRLEGGKKGKGEDETGDIESLGAFDDFEGANEPLEREVVGMGEKLGAGRRRRKSKSGGGKRRKSGGRRKSKSGGRRSRRSKSGGRRKSRGKKGGCRT